MEAELAAYCAAESALRQEGWTTTSSLTGDWMWRISARLRDCAGSTVVGRGKTPNHAMADLCTRVGLVTCAQAVREAIVRLGAAPTEPPLAMGTAQ